MCVLCVCVLCMCVCMCAVCVYVLCVCVPCVCVCCVCVPCVCAVCACACVCAYMVCVRDQWLACIVLFKWIISDLTIPFEINHIISIHINTISSSIFNYFQSSILFSFQLFRWSRNFDKTSSHLLTPSFHVFFLFLYHFLLFFFIPSYFSFSFFTFKGFITASTYAVDFPYILEQTHELTVHTIRALSHILQRIKNSSSDSIRRLSRNIRMPRIGSLSLTGNHGSVASSGRTISNLNSFNNDNNRANEEGFVSENNAIQPHYVNVILHRLLCTLSSASLTVQSKFRDSKTVILHAFKYSTEKIRKTILFLLRFLLRIP